MRYRGHDASTDANQPDIVEALRAVPGCSVRVIGRPVDLLVGFRGRNYLLEVKAPLGPKGGASDSRLTAPQVEFFQSWPGSACVVRTVAEALGAIGVDAGPEKETA